MNPYALSVLIFAICSFLIGAQVYLSRRDEIGLRYFICSVLYSGWGFGYSFSVSGNISYGEALINFRISNAAAAFIPCAWLHFCLIYVDRKINVLKLSLLYLLPTLILFSCLSTHLIPSLRPSGGFVYYPYPGMLFYLETAIYFVLVPIAFYFLINHLKKITGEERQKLIGFISVSMAGYLGGGVTFFPVYDVQMPQYGVFLLPLYPFGLAYFMSTRGLLSLENLVAIAHKDKLAALGIVTASMNHEIRSPLFLMRGLIETKEENSQLKEQLLSQINRVTDIVSRLTHFAKKGVDEEAKIESLDLNEVLADIRPLFQHQLNYQNIEYIQEVPKGLPKVMADRRYLEEILFNLIVNACQALKNTREPQIKLSASFFEDKRLQAEAAVVSPSSIAIAIEDNGPGFADKQLKNVFKPFHTTKDEGTGLGLYITRQLVEKCGGKINMERLLSSRTQFKIYLKI